jgi:hypothetical protein
MPGDSLIENGSIWILKSSCADELQPESIKAINKVKIICSFIVFI